MGDQAGVQRSHPVADHLVVAGGVTLVLEHQVVAIRLEQLHVGLAHRRQHVRVGLGDRRVELGRAPRERLGDQLKPALHRRQEQLALVLEQAEHVRLSDADAARDAVYRRAVQAAVCELVYGGLDQRGPAL